MTTLGAPFAHAGAERIHIRRIYQSDLNWALAEGWKDFKAARGDLIILALIYPLFGLVVAAAASNDQVLPLFFPLVAGVTILGPAAASGFYELARRRELGLDTSWPHFFDPMRGRSRAPLALLTLGLILLFAAWLLSAWLVYDATLGPARNSGMLDFARRVFTTPRGWLMIVTGDLIGFGFAILTLVLTLVSFPMVVDRSVDPAIAVETSVRAVARNPLTVAIWGLRVGLLLVLGCLPMFVGLAVVLPVLGYATWHLYTRIVER
jgi:uncharacterized membrane protein